MNAIPLINNAPKFRPEVNVNVNHIGGQSFNPVSPQMGNAMRQNPYGNEAQLRQEVNTSIVALKREAFSLENLIAQAAQTLQDINNRLAELEGKQGDYVKKTDVTNTIESGNMNPVTSNGLANSNAMPVNSVTSGNMHSVTSNAVSQALSSIGTQVSGVVQTGAFPASGDFTGDTIGNITLSKGVWVVIAQIGYNGYAPLDGVVGISYNSSLDYFRMRVPNNNNTNDLDMQIVGFDYVTADSVNRTLDLFHHRGVYIFSGSIRAIRIM